MNFDFLHTRWHLYLKIPYFKLLFCTLDARWHLELQLHFLHNSEIFNTLDGTRICKLHIPLKFTYSNLTTSNSLFLLLYQLFPYIQVLEEFGINLVIHVIHFHCVCIHLTEQTLQISVKINQI